MGLIFLIYTDFYLEKEISVNQKNQSHLCSNYCIGKHVYSPVEITSFVVKSNTIIIA